MKMMQEYSAEGLDDWELELIDKYPLIYREYDERVAEICRRTGQVYSRPYCNLRHGFEFGKEWRNLANEFSDTATKLVLHLRSGAQKDAYIHSSIFKEKFGTLRWQGHHNLAAPFDALFRAYVNDLATRQITDSKEKK